MDNETNNTESTETAETIETTNNQIENTDVETPDENNEEDTGAKKYTDDDVDEIVKKRLSRAQKKFEKEQQEKVDEAKKLAKMNADQKKDYQLDKIQQEAQEAKAKLAKYEMRDSASDMFNDQGITASREALDLVTTSEAESTQSNVGKMVKVIQSMREQITKELTKGSTPRVSGNKSSITKEDIMKITDPIERQQKIQENMNLFTDIK